MPRTLALLAVAAAALAVAGCRCNPCPRPCDPCAPVAGFPPPPPAGPGAPGMILIAPGGGATVAPGGAIQVEGATIEIEGEAKIVVVGPDGKPHETTFRLGEGKGEAPVVVIGPDGKPVEMKGFVVEGKGHGARVESKDGKMILVITEDEDEEHEGKEHEGRGHEGAGAKPHEPAPPPTAPQGQPVATDRGFLGFQPMPVAFLPPEARTEMGIKAEHGVAILAVVPGSPADKAGLKAGDVLVRLAGHEMPSDAGIDHANPETAEAFLEAFAKIGAGIKPGAEVEMVVERDGKPVPLKATAISMEELRKLAPNFGREDDEEDEGHEGPEKK